MVRRMVETDGARIVCVEDGNGELPLLFLHYWGGSSATWARVIQQIGGKRRCIALDQRGWGGSEVSDGRYDLDAMADDAAAIAATLALGRYVVVGHSMGGKVAQIMAARGAPGLAGMVLVAPAPPTPMQVPPEVRADMLASYGSAAGVDQAIQVLAGRPLDDAEHAQVVADTLAGDRHAKREWIERGMRAVVPTALRDFTGPVQILVGEHDQVERPDALRAAFGPLLPRAAFTTIPAVGHLTPIEAPDAIASACEAVVGKVEQA